MSESGLPPARAFWERVESERNSRGWTTVELQERSGVDRSTVSRLKTSKRSPLPETVNKLADVLDIPRDEALRLAGLVAAPSVHDAVTAPQPAVVSIGIVEGDADTEDLLSRLAPHRRRFLEQIRESEKERLVRIAEDVTREAQEANKRFAELVRIEAEESDKS